VSSEQTSKISFEGRILGGKKIFESFLIEIFLLENFFLGFWEENKETLELGKSRKLGKIQEIPNSKPSENFLHTFFIFV